ncbi:hypothetical protein AB0O67_08630 [Streptomyces sp. NPDC086077]|uniref:hypothetical protein n=1 Tax=Streptomyces sp. NPDC086077 TaxID=3154862 RepID=UPI00342FB361
MRRFHKAAVATVIISSVSFMGICPATAAVAQGPHGGGCRSHDLNIDILGQVGILNGLGGNLINGEGDPGAQVTDIGSDCDDDH